MTTRVDARRGSRSTIWRIAGYVVAALGLVGLASYGAWLWDVCVPSGGSGCFVRRPLPGQEASLAAVGVAAGVAGVWAIGRGVRSRWRAVPGLVLAVGLLAVGRWWAGPRTPFIDAWFTGHHPLLVWFGLAGGVLASAVTWAWWHRRSPIWLTAATATVAFTALFMIGFAYGVSYLE